METDQMASSVSELQAIIKNIDGEISRLQTLIVTEDDKMLRYKVGPSFLTCLFLNIYTAKKDTTASATQYYLKSHRYTLKHLAETCVKGVGNKFQQALHAPCNMVSFVKLFRTSAARQVSARKVEPLSTSATARSGEKTRVSPCNTSS